MAIIERHTGFEGCSSDADVQALVDEVGRTDRTRYSADQGFNGGKCIYSLDLSYYPFYWNVSPAKTKVVGFHVKNIGTFDYHTGAHTHSIRMTVGTSYLRLFNTSTGLKLYRDYTLIASSSTVIDAAQHHVEFKIFSDTTNGTFNLKLDGAEVVFDNQTGLNTSGNDITQVLWGCTNKGYVYYDNPFIADDWVGELKHEVCYPTSDHSVSFTPTTGTDNYAMVDDAGHHDGDTTTVSASASGTKDLYGYTDLPAGLNVKCATVVTPAKKDDVGTVILNVLAKQDSTDYEVGSKALTAGYPAGIGTAPTKVVATQPDGTDWGDSSTFNDIYWGFEVD